MKIKLLMFLFVFVLAITLFGCAPTSPSLGAERCQIGPIGVVNCQNFELKTDGTATITLENAGGKADLESATLTLESGCEPKDVDFKKRETLTFTCIVKPGEEGQLYKQDIKLTYGTEPKHIMQGQLIAKYK